MIKKLALGIAVLLLTATTLSARHRVESGPLTLWYKAPAADWNGALPIGNGRLGAMIFGNADNELLQLNENTLYSGEPATRFYGPRHHPGISRDGPSARRGALSGGLGVA